MPDGMNWVMKITISSSAGSIQNAVLADKSCNAACFPAGSSSYAVAVPGRDGQDLSFEGGALTADTEFEIVASRPTEEGHAVQRRAPVPVAVRPDPGRSVAAVETTIGEGEETEASS